MEPVRLAELPPTIELTLDEASTVLLALLDGLDVVNDEGTAAAAMRKGYHVLARKLWPELGEVLDDEGG